MEPGEATGPDDVAAELWKSRHWNSAEWLTAFFNKVVEEKKTPVDWHIRTHYRPPNPRNHSSFDEPVWFRSQLRDDGCNSCGTPVDRKASRETEASASSLPRSGKSLRPRFTRSHLVRTALAGSP
ncbi:hypothetical protein Y032_0296g1688 [Ancylostoma ceylanicum]|uniref:Uncharacterized protein n=1 Tax=Ancylostoma ceylanicum TaxID=53326 RepID=A0A016S4I0_9BILA|nr:hypothetical protein Y032_0296g1688 [Ancylostoma ceylanicum]